jgi:hypothetical protein
MNFRNINKFLEILIGKKDCENWKRLNSAWAGNGPWPSSDGMA